MKKLSIQRRAQNQRGFTLTELLVGTVVLAIGVALMTILLFGALDDRRGETEGKRAAIAAMCGSKMGRSMGSLGSVTVAAMINSGCFGKDEKIQNRRATNASLANNSKNTDYTMALGTIEATNDSVCVQTQVAQAECTATVEGAADAGAALIQVTPAGGSALTVKSGSARVNMVLAGGQNACNGAAPIAVSACARY